MVDFSQPNQSPYIDLRPYSSVLQGLSQFGQQLPGQPFDQKPFDTKVAPSKGFKSGAPLPGVLPSINVPPTTQNSPSKFFNDHLLRYLGPQGGPVQ